ncbi:UDP-glucose 4-epimerase family protein [Marinobacterium aestuariivivens]|uniref:UDP-glucose 4-epimerase family protein n=1 Tax=Marinobacterium aestuariivivens TaxID=1698799 RepID=A0ABW1ZX36_9GAMM
MSTDRATLLITGSTGFVGSALCECLIGAGTVQLICASRSPITDNRVDTPLFDLCDLQLNAQVHRALEQTDILVHCAARVHVMDDDASDPLSAFRAVNTTATLELARAAALAGVGRFIFLSSIKVNGESTLAGKPFTAGDACGPTDSYAISKWEAEQGLLALAKNTGMEVVIIRPPLVYGPGVKANFRTLLEWIERGIPLPLASVQNRRSLVGLDNLVDLIVTCIDHPAAANQTFLVSDNHDLSTPELITIISEAMGKRSRLFPFPVSLLRKTAELAGRGSMASRLCDSLQVDITHTMETLGWKPPLSVEEGIQRTVDDFLERSERKVSTRSGFGKEKLRRGGSAPTAKKSFAEGARLLQAKKRFAEGARLLQAKRASPRGLGSYRQKELRREGSAPTGTKDGASREPGRG